MSQKQCKCTPEDIYYDGLNWVCKCDKIVDPDNPPYEDKADNS